LIYKLIDNKRYEVLNTYSPIRNIWNDTYAIFSKRLCWKCPKSIEIQSKQRYSSKGIPQQRPRIFKCFLKYILARGEKRSIWWTLSLTFTKYTCKIWWSWFRIEHVERISRCIIKLTYVWGERKICWIGFYFQWTY
jgi:hypothetical protein